MLKLIRQLFIMKHLVTGSVVIFILTFICCVRPSGQLDDSTRIKQSIEQGGDPFVIIAGKSAMLIKNAEAELLERVGIRLEEENHISVDIDADSSHVIPFVYGSTMEALMEYAFLMLDSREPVKIIRHRSDCIEPVTCQTECLPLGRHFFYRESYIFPTPLECKRVNEDKTCTETWVAVCDRVFYTDPECDMRAGSMQVFKWRCN